MNDKFRVEVDFLSADNELVTVFCPEVAIASVGAKIKSMEMSANDLGMKFVHACVLPVVEPETTAVMFSRHKER